MKVDNVIFYFLINNNIIDGTESESLNYFSFNLSNLYFGSVLQTWQCIDNNQNQVWTM